MMKTHDEIVADVKHDWATEHGQAVLRRRWPKLTDPLEIQTAEIKFRLSVQQLPGSLEESADRKAVLSVYPGAEVVTDGKKVGRRFKVIAGDETLCGWCSNPSAAWSAAATRVKDAAE